LLDPTAAEKSAAAKVEELTYTGVPTEVTAPTEAAILKVKRSPVCRVAGPVAPVDVIHTNAVTAWPAGKSAGVILKPTLLVDWANVQGTGMSSATIPRVRMIEIKARFVCMVFSSDALSCIAQSRHKLVVSVSLGSDVLKSLEGRAQYAPQVAD